MPLSDYTELNFIESDGSVYISTNIKANGENLNVLKIEADMAFTAFGVNDPEYLFGTGYYNSTSANRRMIACGHRSSTSSTQFTFVNGNATNHAAGLGTLDKERHIFGIDQINSKYYIDDDDMVFTGTVNSNLSKTLLIFATRSSASSGEPISAISRARLFGFKVWSNGVLIADFIPVERISDGIIGAYDIVGDAFYQGVGGGRFTAGYKTLEPFIPCAGLRAYLNGYIDIGLLPSNNLSVDIMYYGSVEYIFGARNTNSNTSAGQFSYYAGSSGSDVNAYVGYNNARTSLGYINGYHFHIGDGIAETNEGNTKMSTVSLSSASFSGTQPIYLYALNNGGTAVTSGCVIFGALFKENGKVIKRLVPVYMKNSFGIVDLENNVFYPVDTSTNFYSMHLVTVEQTEGGSGLIETLMTGYSTKEYGGCVQTSSFGQTQPVHLVATPKTGYSFLNWVDENDNVISNEKEFDYVPVSDVIVKAIFTKDSRKEFKTGFKTLGIRYGSYHFSASKSYRDDFYADIITASINIDAVQKTVSTITVKSVPSVYQPNMVIFVLNPRGMVVYCGVIESIKENVLTCREPLFLVDNEYLKHTISQVNSSTGINYAQYSIMFQYGSYIAREARPTDVVISVLSDAIYERLGGQLSASINSKLNLAYEDNLSVYSEDVEQPTIINREDWGFDLFNKYGIICTPKLVVVTGPTQVKGHGLQIIVNYFKQFRKIVIGDNNEEITNVSLTKEDMETTYLYIFNGTGTTFRGIRAVTNDGAVVEYDGTSANAPNLIAYNTLKYKIVNSDGKIKDIVEENLANAMYNHLITFDMDLGGSFYHFEDIQIGAPCDFHYNGNIYESIVTGLSFDVDSNSDEIKTGKVTLGKARNNLTSKLNLRKVKK